MQRFLCSVIHVFYPENGTDWKLNQAMSPAFLIAVQGYIDHRCTWKRFREISRKLKCSIFHVFRFSLISRERFHVQRRSTYPWKAIVKAGDIDWFNFQSVSFFTVKNVKKRNRQSFLCSVFHVFIPGKWNGLEIKPAYVTRLFNSFPRIY